MATPGSTPEPSAASSAVTPLLIPQGKHANANPIPVGRPVFEIGASRRSHLSLVSKSISRSHAIIVVTGGGAYIRDLASREGTFVDDQRVREADLTDGCLLRVGTFSFRFVDRRPRQRTRAVPPAQLAGPAGIVVPRGRSLLIGRRTGSDVLLEDEAATSAHAVVVSRNGRWIVRDLNTNLGTLVNGRPAHQELLEFGDELQVGQTLLALTAAADTAAAAEAAGSSVLPIAEVEPVAPAPEQAVPAPVAPARAAASVFDDAAPLELDALPLDLDLPASLGAPAVAESPGASAEAAERVEITPVEEAAAATTPQDIGLAPAAQIAAQFAGLDALDELAPAEPPPAPVADAELIATPELPLVEGPSAEQPIEPSPAEAADPVLQAMPGEKIPAAKPKRGRKPKAIVPKPTPAPKAPRKGRRKAGEPIVAETPIAEPSPPELPAVAEVSGPSEPSPDSAIDLAALEATPAAGEPAGPPIEVPPLTDSVFDREVSALGAGLGEPIVERAAEPTRVDRNDGAGATEADISEVAVESLVDGPSPHQVPRDAASDDASIDEFAFFAAEPSPDTDDLPPDHFDLSAEAEVPRPMGVPPDPPAERAAAEAAERSATAVDKAAPVAIAPVVEDDRPSSSEAATPPPLPLARFDVADLLGDEPSGTTDRLAVGRDAVGYMGGMPLSLGAPVEGPAAWEMGRQIGPVGQPAQADVTPVSPPPAVDVTATPPFPVAPPAVPPVAATAQPPSSSWIDQTRTSTAALRKPPPPPPAAIEPPAAAAAPMPPPSPPGQRPMRVPPRPKRPGTPFAAAPVAASFDLSPSAITGGDLHIPPFNESAAVTSGIVGSGRMTTAFDGLAISAVREVDVFSQQLPTEPPPAAEVPVSGSGKAQAVSIASAASDMAAPSPRAVRPSVPPARSGQVMGYPSARGRNAVPGSLEIPKALSRDGGGAGQRVDTADRRAGRRRFTLRWLLPIMVATMAAAVGAIVWFVPVRGLVFGSLAFDNLDNPNRSSTSLQTIEEAQTRLLNDPAVRSQAAALLHNNSPNLSPGFLAADGDGLVEWGRTIHLSWQPTDGRPAKLVIRRDSTSIADDTKRMKALLQAMATENAQFADASSRAVAARDAIQQEIHDLNKVIAANQLKIKNSQDLYDAAPSEQEAREAAGPVELLHQAYLAAQQQADAAQAAQQSTAATQPAGNALATAQQSAAAAAVEAANAKVRWSAAQSNLVEMQAKLTAAHAEAGKTVQLQQDVDDEQSRLDADQAKLTAAQQEVDDSVVLKPVTNDSIQANPNGVDLRWTYAAGAVAVIGLVFVLLMSLTHGPATAAAARGLRGDEEGIIETSATGPRPRPTPQPVGLPTGTIVAPVANEVAPVPILSPRDADAPPSPLAADAAASRSPEPPVSVG